MAKPNIANANYDFDKESEVLIDDNGATRPLSNSLFNMSNVQKCSVKISLADREMSIKATQSGFKSYFIKDVNSAIHKCIGKDLHHDLLGGRALVTANYRVILDKDPRISGIFSVTDGEIDPATVLPFLDSIQKVFTLLKVEIVPLSETQLGYSLLHRRLGHCPMQTIRDTITIPHAKGIEELRRPRGAGITARSTRMGRLGAMNSVQRIL